MTANSIRLTAEQFIEKMNLAAEFYVKIDEQAFDLVLKFIDDHGVESNYLGPRLNDMNHESYLAFLRKVDELAGTHTIANTYLKTRNKVGKSTRLTAQEFVDKIKTSANWSIVESADTEELELLVFTGNSVSPIERYLGPDPMTTDEGDLMSFLYYLEELVTAYNTAAAAEFGDDSDEVS